MSHVLTTGFGLSKQAIYNVLSKNEQHSFDYAVTEIKLVFRSQTNGALVRVFNDYFKKDDTGKSRDWQQIEEQRIREVFEASKTKVMLLLDEFKKVGLS